MAKVRQRVGKAQSTSQTTKLLRRTKVKKKNNLKLIKS